MARYVVSVPWYAAVLVDVEADSEEDAKEKGLEEAYASLCHQCSKNVNMDGGPADDQWPPEATLLEEEVH